MEVPENNSFDSPNNSAQALDDLLDLLTKLKILDKEDYQESKEDHIIQKSLEKKQEYTSAKTSTTQPTEEITNKVNQNAMSIKISKLEKKVNELEKKNMNQKK